MQCSEIMEQSVKADRPVTEIHCALGNALLRRAAASSKVEQVRPVSAVLSDGRKMGRRTRLACV